MANRLRILRKSKGLTQKELAKLCGLTQSNIAMIENEDRDLSFSVAQKLARALKCKAYELMPAEEQPEILTEEEKEFLRLFRKSKANNGNETTIAKAE